MPWYVYILRCSDDSLYTGITTNIKRRIKVHNDGKGSKSILGKRPVELAYIETAPDKINAAKREREIKGWKRAKKVNLIDGCSVR